MTQITEIGTTIVALETRIEAKSADLDELKGRQRIALIGVERGTAGSQEEADALAVQVREAKDHLQALRETLADARQAEPMPGRPKGRSQRMPRGWRTSAIASGWTAKYARFALP